MNQLLEVDVDKLNTKYSGCYTTVNIDGVNSPCKISAFITHDTAVVLVYKSTRKVITLEVPANSLNLEYPTLGYINLMTTSVFLERTTRNTESRYKQLLTNRHVNILDICSVERSLLNLKMIYNLDRDIIFKIFFREYFTPLKALDLIKKFKRISAAFSPEYCFKLDAQSNSIILYRNSYKAGKVNIENNSVILPEKLKFLKEELEEWGLFIEIKDIEIIQREPSKRKTKLQKLDIDWQEWIGFRPEPIPAPIVGE